MDNLIPVENNKFLKRDLNSNAVVNVDKNSYHAYKQAKKIRSNENERIENLEIELKNIKNNIDEIKQLLININNQKLD